MEKRLIEASAVMESLTKEYNQRRTGDGLKLAWIEKAVNDTQEAAVRCADCENCHSLDYAGKYFTCSEWHALIKPEEYCSRGRSRCKRGGRQ